MTNGHHGAACAAEIARFVLEAPRGSLRALAGIDAESLRAALDSFEPDPSRALALSLAPGPSASAEALIENVLAALAAVAQGLWPLWWGVALPDRDDPLGRGAAVIAARAAPDVAAPWAEAAATLALKGRRPRVKGTHPAIEIAELARIVSPSGLVLVVDGDEAARSPFAAAWVRGLEWVAEHVDGAVVALFSELPPNAPPFDRILYDALSFSRPPAPLEVNEPVSWLAPWRGRPHPMSEIEQRLAAALGADAELGPLFAFNQTVATARGGTPKVDLVWARGRLAVEIDGWGSHGNRLSFMQDRHRDYELILSGFLVLRLTNDEIAEDLEKALEKIRDVVHFCRGRLGET
jgi:very-short-patch-repair endonuclease